MAKKKKGSGKKTSGPSTAVIVGVVVALIGVALVATQLGSSSRSGGGKKNGKKDRKKHAPSPAPAPSTPKVTPLMAFARRGDLSTVKQIVARMPNLDINAVDPRGMTAVYYALEGRHENILRQVGQSARRSTNLNVARAHFLPPSLPPSLSLVAIDGMEPGRAMHTPHLISVLCWAALAPLMRVLSSSRAIAAVQLAARTLETRPCPHVPRGYPATLQGCAFMLTCALVSCGHVTGRPGPLDGQQEEVIEYLASQPSFDAEVGCPVYYAVHFRNLPGLQSLLERSSQASLKECVSGFTSFKAVHVVGLRTAGQARALSRRIFACH